MNNNKRKNNNNYENDIVEHDRKLKSSKKIKIKDLNDSNESDKYAVSDEESYEESYESDSSVESDEYDSSDSSEEYDESDSSEESSESDDSHESGSSEESEESEEIKKKINNNNKISNIILDNLFQIKKHNINDEIYKYIKTLSNKKKK